MPIDFVLAFRYNNKRYLIEIQLLNYKMSIINILVNDQDLSVKNGSNIADLINQLELDVKKVAVELNLEIIAPESFATTEINDGDKIEIVHFIGGG